MHTKTNRDDASKYDRIIQYAKKKKAKPNVTDDVYSLLDSILSLFDFISSFTSRVTKLIPSPQSILQKLSHYIPFLSKYTEKYLTYCILTQQC